MRSYVPVELDMRASERCRIREREGLSLQSLLSVMGSSGSRKMAAQAKVHEGLMEFGPAISSAAAGGGRSAAR